MAYSAQGGSLNDPILWLLFAANCFWTIAYDTYYAMTDREDDLKIGIKSTAILFGKQDLLIIILLQALMLLCLAWVGAFAQLSWPYFASLVCCIGLFYQQFHQARNRDRMACFRSFLNNNRIGLCIFVGLNLSFFL